MLSEILNEEQEQTLVEHISKTVLKIVDTSDRLQTSQWANAEKVLADIDEGTVFDDIKIEFADVLSKGLERF